MLSLQELANWIEEQKHFKMGNVSAHSTQMLTLDIRKATDDSVALLLINRS
jgi:hypothetical protein